MIYPDAPFHRNLFQIARCHGQSPSLLPPKNPNSNDSPTREDPLEEWIASAPPGIQRLIDLGQVTLGIDDQELETRKKQGLTKFRFDYRYRYRFNHQEIPARSSGDPTELAIAATILLSEVKLTHKVLVGSKFKPEQPWKSRLLQHEFDHVSISTDPRLRILLRQVLGAPMKFQLAQNPPDTEASGVPSAAPLEKRVDQQISQFMTQRVQEIERITQALNDRFDRESNNGAGRISQREEFFSSYYTAETLIELNFKYPEILEQYAKQIAKANWKEHYAWNTPP